MGMEFVEIIMRAEEDFEIEIPDAEAELLATVGALADYVEQRRPDVGRDEVWRRVRAMVSEQEDVPLHLIERGSRWAQDLGFG